MAIPPQINQLYAVREITDANGNGLGRYLYCTKTPDGSYRAAGYCAGPCPGHIDRQGAREHFRAFLNDHDIFLDGVRITEVDDSGLPQAQITSWYYYTTRVAGEWPGIDPVIRERDAILVDTSQFIGNDLLLAQEESDDA